MNILHVYSAANAIRRTNCYCYYYDDDVYYVPFHEFCTSVWWVVRVDSMQCMCSCIQGTHTRCSLTYEQRIQCIRIGSNSKATAAAAFSLPFTAYTVRFGFLFVLSNAKHIFYTSNTCITCCLTFYSRQCSVSFCCCCADACICVTNANSFMYASIQFVLHAFASSFQTFQMI